MSADGGEKFDCIIIHITKVVCFVKSDAICKSSTIWKQFALII